MHVKVSKELEGGKLLFSQSYTMLTYMVDVKWVLAQ